MAISAVTVGTAPSRNNNLFQKIGKVGLAHQETWNGAQRDGCKLVKDILGPSVAADGMPISKERGGRHHRVPGLPEAPQPLADPRGLVTYENQMTSLHF